MMAQNSLHDQLRAIAAESKGSLSIACSLPGSTLDCNLNEHAHPPMQSVFKLPLAIAVLQQVESGKLELNTKIHFAPKDRILPRTHSPLQDRYPRAGVDVEARELIELSITQSDNTAADLLLKTIGGPEAVNRSMHALGIDAFHMENNEHDLHRDDQVQYRNWIEPAAAVALLRRLNDSSPLSAEHTKLLMSWLRAASPQVHRISGDLPQGVRIYHKTGTSDSRGGMAPATNDIGLIELPDGRRLAVALFLTDSRDDAATCDKLLARAARALYDAAVSGSR